MHTFYHQGHIRHDPAQLHKPEPSGKNTYYSEVAQRGEVIFEAIKTADLGPIIPPGDFSLEPIGEIHEYGMISLLQNAFERMKNEAESHLAIPNTFNIRQELFLRKPRSIWGLLGYYTFDLGSPIFRDTWDVAYWSAQTAISAAALVAASEGEAAYALCRPPGHHAGSNFFGGFCYLNNVAIAANWLVQQGQRVAILDIDYHHGNGTQSIFYNRSDVLVCSIHADPFNEYPYYWGYADEFGTNGGENYNFNYPLPLGTNAETYLKELEKALDRIRRFVPNTLLVSFGADTIEGDPVGGFKLDTHSMYQIGEKINQLDIPTVIIQEGGYLLSSLGENVVSFLKGIEANG